VRIAVLADVHGNLPALRAVLAELDRDPVDAIVVAGDVVAGPLVAESLETLRDRPEPTHWISGNSEREAVAAYDGAPVGDDPAGRASAWSARALDRAWRAELGSWPITMALDRVRFCHGSPRSDEEIITRITPDEVLLNALSGVDEGLVVGGHTHQQFVRQVRDGLTYANAGSIGLPYEGRPGAFWMIVADRAPEFRETAYDIGAVQELRTPGFDFDDQLGPTLLDPVDPDWVSAFFEHMAGRGEDPGEPPPARR
jgi:putative phosphoesterase